jgi:glycosyltransferase involved in cell wall biosynthesis
MTAALAPGDAIGNYIHSLVMMLERWGCTVHLYTDHPNERYPVPHHHTSAYAPTGNDLLWLHYSIYTENLHWLRDSSDLKIMDVHHVCPAYLFHGYDAHMEHLCAKGERMLGTFTDYVDATVVHTEYVRHDLEARGYNNIHKLPLVVDTSRFTTSGAPGWNRLLRELDYLLFVGRVVPQKNVKQALDVFAALHRRRPNAKFFIVGGHSLPTYVAELEDQIAALGIGDAAVITGPMTEPDVLTSFYRHARFYLCLSAWESFCVPIVESLYFGTPVLGHNVPPIPETMGPGGVVLAGTPAAMAAQIDALWDDGACYAQLQRLGKQHAQQFTDAQLEHALLDFFNDLGRR